MGVGQGCNNLFNWVNGRRSMVFMEKHFKEHKPKNITESSSRFVLGGGFLITSFSAHSIPSLR